MTGIVHALIGAAAGSFFKNKIAAFAAGVATHAVADSLPHDDFTPEVEVPLAAVALTMLGAWKGFDSPEMAGAIGGMSPDFEHALHFVGAIKDEHKIFPTHINDGEYHGPKSGEMFSQFLLAIGAVAVVALNSPKNDVTKQAPEES